MTPAAASEQAAALMVAPDPAFILRPVRDRDGTAVELQYAYLNEAEVRLLGRPPESVLGHGLCELFPSVRELGIFDAYVNALGSASPISFEVQSFRENGVEGSFRLTASRLSDDAVLVTARDITEQREAELALAETTWEYRLVAENASDVVARATPDRKLTWVSPTVTRTLGWEPAELVGTEMADLVHPDDRPALDTLRETVYAGQRISLPAGGFVCRMRTKSGDYRWMSGGATPVTDESGAYVGVVASMKDVDDLVHAQHAAQADRATLRATVDSLLDPHVLLTAVRDETGRIVDFTCADANPAASEHIGVSQQELLGTRLLDLAPGEFTSSIVDSFRRVVETGVPIVLDDEVYPHYLLGVPRRYDIRAARVGDGLSYNWRDVTDRHAAAEQLAESQERYRLLAENASDVVFMTGPDRRTVWIAPPVTRVLGWSPEELVGTKMIDLLRPETAAELEPRLRRFFSSPNTEPCDTRVVEMRTKSGDYRWLSGSGHALTSPEGTLLGVVFGLSDVTDVVRARDRLQATLDTEFDPHVLLEAVRDDAGRVVDFVYVEANPAACEYNGLTHDALVGARVLDLLPGLRDAGMFRLYEHLVRTGKPMRMNDLPYKYELKGGEERRFDLQAVQLGDGMSYTWRDVTDRYDTAQALAASEEQHRLLTENLSDVVMHLRGGVIVWVTPSVTTALGWALQDVVGHELIEFVVPDDRREADQRRALLPGATERFRVRVRAKDGTDHWVQVHAKPFYGQDGEPDGVVNSFRIIDREVAVEAELEQRASSDELTGLMNRREVLERLELMTGHKSRSGQAAAVLFCDIDGFKTINDKYGHSAGDDVLQTVASRVNACLRSTDLAARFGGDELLILLDGVHELANALDIAENIRRAVAKPIPSDDKTVTATLSVGVTLALPGESVDDMIARADEAMYEAKQAGGDRVIPRMASAT
ncbi:PAS domain S-box protein [Pengzhenrongella sp.]|jgi:diguanylate cyclase (GGDEF)-like protein/PAS domain S-box-containing protein|uniref:sensor domain-containing diguanylate cyclase n=1 Tax=Pengzhenrongella sp. TaxID=2888820 RepID=UPI002F959FAD